MGKAEDRLQVIFVCVLEVCRFSDNTSCLSISLWFERKLDRVSPTLTIGSWLFIVICVEKFMVPWLLVLLIWICGFCHVCQKEWRWFIIGHALKIELNSERCLWLHCLLVHRLGDAWKVLPLSLGSRREPDLSRSRNWSHSTSNYQ